MSFPRYERYKESGVEWLGMVPEHWEVERLSFVASINDEALPEDTAADFEMQYLDISSVTPGSVELTPVTLRFSEAPSRARRKVMHGDTVISTVRTYLRAIAPILDPPQNLIASTGFAVLRSRGGQSSSFLAYAVQASSFIEQVIAQSTGVSYPAINAHELGLIKLPIPPALEEQDRSAHFLSIETAKIDALIEEQRRLIELLKEKRQAVLSHAVTRGLQPRAQLKDSGVEGIGEIPAEWSVVRLRMLAGVRGGIAKGRHLGEAESITVPYLRVANVQDGYLNLTEVTDIQIEPHELERYRLIQGDVLMNEGGDFDKLGRGCIWRGEIADCIHQNHVFSVRPSKIEPEWLTLISAAHCGRFYFMTRSKQSTNLASISSSNLRELPIPLPSIAERTAILERVRGLNASIELLIVNALSAIELLQERRSALISAAVTGKIDVRNYANQNTEEAA